MYAPMSWGMFFEISTQVQDGVVVSRSLLSADVERRCTCQALNGAMIPADPVLDISITRQTEAPHLLSVLGNLILTHARTLLSLSHLRNGRI